MVSNQSDGGKTNEADACKTSETSEATSSVPSPEPSVQAFIPKVCASSSSNIGGGRHDSAMGSSESIKTNATDSITRLTQSSNVQANSSVAFKYTAPTDSMAVMKRQETVPFAINKDKGTVLPEKSANVPAELPKRAPSSVVNVDPGASPPVKLEPGAQLHMRQPFKILTDIWGVLTSYSFRKQLFAYIDDHLKEYILVHFEDEDVKDYVAEVARRTTEDLTKGNWPTMPPVEVPETKQDEKQGDGAVGPDKMAIAEAVERNLAFRRDTKDKALMKGLDSIFSQIWNDG